jgi:hypothetical protein
MNTSAKADGITKNENNSVQPKRIRVKLEGIENVFKSRCWFLKQAWFIVFN